MPTRSAGAFDVAALEALTDCAEYTASLDAGEVVAGYVARDLGSFGDQSNSYGNAGTIGGFPIDSDIVVITTGDDLAITTWLSVGAAADGSVTVLAEGAAEILAGLG